MKFTSCLCEAVVEASIVECMSLFAEVDMFHEWFPNVTECKVIKEVTPYRGLY